MLEQILEETPESLSPRPSPRHPQLQCLDRRVRAALRSRNFCLSKRQPGILH